MRVHVLQYHPMPDYDFQLIPGEQYDVAEPFGRPHFSWMGDINPGAPRVGDMGTARFRVADSSHSFEAVVRVESV